jgi:DNA-binding NtrC family response regulator
MPIKTLIVSDDDSTAREIETLISGEPDLQLVGTAKLDDALETMQKQLPKLVWLDFGPKPMRGMSQLAILKENHAGTFFIVSFEMADFELIRTSQRIGSFDYFTPKTWREDLRQCVPRLLPAVSGRNALTISPERIPFTVVLVTDADENIRKEIQMIVKAQGKLSLSKSISIAEASTYFAGSRPDIIWVELRPDRKSSMQLVKTLREQYPRTCLLVSDAGVMDSTQLLQAFRLGVSDYFDPERWRTDLPATLQMLTKPRAVPQERMSGSAPPARQNPSAGWSSQSAINIVAVLITILALWFLYYFAWPR